MVFFPSGTVIDTSAPDADARLRATRTSSRGAAASAQAMWSKTSESVAHPPTILHEDMGCSVNSLTVYAS